jgi:hypothetical protein
MVFFEAESRNGTSPQGLGEVLTQIAIRMIEKFHFLLFIRLITQKSDKHLCKAVVSIHLDSDHRDIFGPGISHFETNDLSQLDLDLMAEPLCSKIHDMNLVGEDYKLE